MAVSVCVTGGVGYQTRWRHGHICGHWASCIDPVPDSAGGGVVVVWAPDERMITAPTAPALPEAWEEGTEVTPSRLSMGLIH